MAYDVETPEHALAFVIDIIAVCKKHGIWITHEDEYGAFLMRRESSEEWLMEMVSSRSQAYRERANRK